MKRVCVIRNGCILFETGVFVGGSQQSEIESILSIEIGKGTRPTSATSFDAREVRDNLQPKTEE